MPRLVTQYDVLISCTGEVKEELDIIRDTLHKFNKNVGRDKNISLNHVHWSTHAFPESGGKGQSLLNDQFVIESDFAIAVFWTRFGTPTDKYGSGTEEEIEILLKQGKQVFVYFSTCPTDPDQLNIDQWNKVKAFREKYADRGLYWTYKSPSELKDLLYDHLSTFVSKKLNDKVEFKSDGSEGNASIKVDSGSRLSVVGTYRNRILDVPYAYQTNYSETFLNADSPNAVLSFVNEIKEIVITKKIDEKEEEEAIVALNESLFKTLGPAIDSLKTSMNIQSSNVVLSDYIKNTIKEHLVQNGIVFDEDTFFYLGDLRLKSNLITQSFGGQGNMIGNENEKKKHSLLMNLYWKIDKIYQFNKYFSQIDSKHMVDLVLDNSGEKFDEDIDVKLFIEQGYLCYPEDLPFPEDALWDIDELYQSIYKSKETPYIAEYKDQYKFQIEPINFPLYPMMKESFQEKIGRKLDAYRREIKSIFDYTIFKGVGVDAISYNQGYLKPDSKVHFPSRLVFNKLPEKISYKYPLNIPQKR
ncbi:MAG: hypothetical protein ACE3L7_02300 [Candidatus Pristimantibacillus sp.]